MTKSCSKERARNRPDASKAEDGANELPAKRSKHRRTQRRFPIVRLAPTIMRCRMLLFEKNRHHALKEKTPPPRVFYQANAGVCESLAAANTGSTRQRYLYVISTRQHSRLSPMPLGDNCTSRIS